MAYAAWPPPSALIMSLSWGCCRGGRRPLLGRGMSCHTDSPAHGQHAGGAGFDAGHVYVPPHVACAPVSFSLTSGTCICFWRTCRAAGILTLICFLGRRWRGSGPEHAGHCPCRRWFRLTLGVALTRRRLLANCVAASTSRVCGSGLNQYLVFCREVGIPHPFPLHEFVLELFVALRGTRLSVATLRTYLAGLQHFSFRFGFPTKLAGMHSLGFVLRGLRRSQADRFTRPHRRPITVTTLILLRAYIHRRFPARDAVMLLAAIFSAFGLLRSAEYCSPSPRRFDPAVHLQYRDLTLDPARGVASLRITASKTDPFPGGGGASVRLCHTSPALCPFTALHQLLGAHPTFVGPLFAFQDGSYLTRARLGHILRGAFPSSCDLNTHSFRIGGASAAAAMGFSSAMIQALGRWRGDSFQRYVQLPAKYVFHARLRMLKLSE